MLDAATPVMNGSSNGYATAPCDGRVYMPKMADYLSQEALWAVRTYLDSVHVEE
jgi:mono/diheme cytochrome c family protein